LQQQSGPSADPSACIIFAAARTNRVTLRDQVGEAIDVEARDSLRVAVRALRQLHQQSQAPVYHDPFLSHQPTGLEG